MIIPFDVLKTYGNRRVAHFWNMNRFHDEKVSIRTNDAQAHEKLKWSYLR